MTPMENRIPVVVYLKPEEKQRIEEAAEKDRMTRSAYMARAADREASRDVGVIR